MSQSAVTVLGAGSYGTALAFCLARNGVDTHLWGRDPAHMQALATARQNERYLPGAQFPPALHIQADFEQALAELEAIFRCQRLAVANQEIRHAALLRELLA